MSDQVLERPSIDQLSDVQARSVLLDYLNRPDTDTRALIQSLSGDLSPAAHKEVAQAAFQALPTTAKQDLATEVVQNLAGELTPAA
jgi:hypothetical protein